MKKALLALMVALFASAGASEAADQSSFFAGLGYVKPSDVDGGTVYFTGGLRFDVADQVAIEPEVGYWKKSEGIESFMSADLSDAMIGANLLYRPTTDEKVGFFVGAGPAVHLVKLGVSVIGLNESETKTKIGAQVLSGVDFKVSEPVGLFATARYDLVGKANWDDLFEINVSGFKLYGGVRINF